MAENSLRTLCLGYKRLTAHDDLEAKDSKGVFECEKEGIILVAIIGVRDIPRKEVPEAIRQCHKAGITVRMVTGDNIITAKAIAKDIGITQEGKDYIALEGPDFSKLVGGVVCKKCRTAVCDCPTDYKKAQPEDKYCLVTALKERGNIVAVTGDGTNDAPALKKADVGFAMGQCGTEVARDAAAIILIDDNFSSIVKAVLWGRNIYDSIRKFVQFQLTVNVVAVATTFDSYDSTIFATKPGYKWLNGVVGGTVRSGRFYTVTGAEDYVSIYNETMIYSRHFTFIFNTFVLLQIFNFLNSRKLHEEILLVTFSGSAFGVYDNYGLTVQQWLITADDDLEELVVGAVLSHVLV
ncbi:uncharacterized protein LOC116244830 [Nymphaea colorata]|nr:uncharacterized protein LOC116244830 [Nymphaea colorata]